MAEETELKRGLKMGSALAVFIGFVATIGGATELGSGCCLFGICGSVILAISSSTAAFNGQDGKMVLKQDPSGTWVWTTDNPGEHQEIVKAGAAQYNEQSSQVLSRVISEVRNGSDLEELEPAELETLAGAYGINGGSKEQKIEALKNSKLASKALKLTAIAAVGGVGAIGAAKIVQSGRERAVQRAEELRQQGKEKLQGNIDKHVQQIDSKLPKNADGETATEVANNVILDQMSNYIKENDMTPEKLIALGDINKDGKLDPVEISGALTAAIGFSVPIFIVKDAIKQFDTNEDGILDSNELHKLWAHLGFDLEEEMEDDAEFSDEEIDAVLEDVEETEVVEEITIVEDHEPEQEEQPLSEEIILDEFEETVIATEDTSNNELTDGIDTEFEELIVEMEEARFTSERRKLMEKQVTDYLVNIRIQKMERTLIGDPVFRGGQSVHGLIDGGPYVGLVKIPVAFDEMILSHKEGDEIKVRAKLVDFSTSLKRPVLEANELL